MRHDEARELLPDFALDLVYQDERGEIIDHLRACDSCMSEVDLYLRGARVLSLAAAHNAPALALKAPASTPADGAVDRVRARVKGLPDATGEQAPEARPRALLSEDGAETAAPASRGWGLFGRGRGKGKPADGQPGAPHEAPAAPRDEVSGVFAEAAGLPPTPVPLEAIADGVEPTAEPGEMPLAQPAAEGSAVEAAPSEESVAADGAVTGAAGALSGPPGEPAPVAAVQQEPAAALSPDATAPVEPIAAESLDPDGAPGPAEAVAASGDQPAGAPESPPALTAVPAEVSATGDAGRIAESPPLLPSAQDVGGVAGRDAPPRRQLRFFGRGKRAAPAATQVPPSATPVPRAEATPDMSVSAPGDLAEPRTAEGASPASVPATPQPPLRAPVANDSFDWALGPGEEDLLDPDVLPRRQRRVLGRHKPVAPVPVLPPAAASETLPAPEVLAKAIAEAAVVPVEPPASTSAPEAEAAPTGSAPEAPASPPPAASASDSLDWVLGPAEDDPLDPDALPRRQRRVLGRHRPEAPAELPSAPPATAPPSPVEVGEVDLDVLGKTAEAPPALPGAPSSTAAEVTPGGSPPDEPGPAAPAPATETLDWVLGPGEDDLPDPDALPRRQRRVLGRRGPPVSPAEFRDAIRFPREQAASAGAPAETPGANQPGEDGSPEPPSAGSDRLDWLLGSGDTAEPPVDPEPPSRRQRRVLGRHGPAAPEPAGQPRAPGPQGAGHVQPTAGVSATGHRRRVLGRGSPASTEPGNADEDFGEDPFFEIALQPRPAPEALAQPPASGRPGKWWTIAVPPDEDEEEDEPAADPDPLPPHFREAPRGSAEAISIVPAPRGRRFLGRPAGETSLAPAPVVARPPVTAVSRGAIRATGSLSTMRPAPLVTPYRRAYPTITPASVPGLDGYTDESDAPSAGARPETYDDGLEGKVGGAWRTATFILACATAALGIGFGVTFYQAFEFRNRASELEAVLPSAAIQMALTGDNVQGVAYFAPQFARGVLAIDGLQPPPAGQRAVLWADSRKNGVAAVTAVVPDLYGSRIYLEIRRTPSDLVRLFVTYEPAGRTLPTVPTGVEVLSGDAPVGLGPLQSAPSSTSR